MCSLQHSAVRHGKNAKKQFGRHPFSMDWHDT